MTNILSHKKIRLRLNICSYDAVKNPDSVTEWRDEALSVSSRSRFDAKTSNLVISHVVSGDVGTYRFKTPFRDLKTVFYFIHC